MVESVVVTEGVIAGIVGDIDVSALDFVGKSFEQRRAGKQIISFDDEVIGIGKTCNVFDALGRKFFRAG